jgi:hypothetical protein
MLWITSVFAFQFKSFSYISSALFVLLICLWKYSNIQLRAYVFFLDVLHYLNISFRTCSYKVIFICILFFFLWTHWPSFVCVEVSNPILQDVSNKMNSFSIIYFSWILELPELMRKQLIFPRNTHIPHNETHVHIFNKIHLKLHCIHNIKRWKYDILLRYITLHYITLVCIKNRMPPRSFNWSYSTWQHKKQSVRKR